MQLLKNFLMNRGELCHLSVPDEPPALFHLRCCCTGTDQEEHCMQGCGQRSQQQRTAQDMGKAHLHLPPWLTCLAQWLPRWDSSISASHPHPPN